MLVDLRNPRGLAFYSYDFDAAMLVKCVQSQRNPQSLQTLQMALQHKAYHRFAVLQGGVFHRSTKVFV